MASRDLANVTNTRDSDLVKKGWLTASRATPIGSTARGAIRR